MYVALYRKYRPSSFKEVVGQKIVVKTLSNAIINNQINHAYLFCGPRGTGKTSIAKIFAKTINCNNLDGIEVCNKCDSCLQIDKNQSIDIIEIDAASNNGVDEIRELKNNVNLVPSTGKYKVYIIDEVHMLTTSAFNALLKTLEEPPKHVIFILATTEVHKIPKTVLSRCQKFDFKKISNDQIVNHLRNVCKLENINIDDHSLIKIADISNGGMRDALSLLDQINSYANGNIKEEDVDEINGNITHEQMYDIVFKMSNSEYINLLSIIKKLDNQGKNLSIVLNSIVDYFKNLLIYVNDSNYFDDEKMINEFEQILSNINEEYIYIIMNELMETIKNIKFDSNKLLSVELCIIKLNSIVNNNKKNNNNNIECKKNVNAVNDNEHHQLNNIEKNEISKCIEKIKKVRINNTLSLFNKKDTLNFKTNLIKLNDMLSDPVNGSLASLILDGELKAKGNEYMLFVYKTPSLENMFNSNIKEIENMLNSVFNIEYKVVAENEQNWSEIKKIFNKAIKENKKIYHFIDDKDIKINSNNQVIEGENIEISKTPIDNMFEEIVQYK